MLITQIKRFFIGAFRDMKNSAKAQHELDRAEFEAVRAESRANFEENRGRNTLNAAKAAKAERAATREAQRVEKLNAAKRRIDKANKRTASAKQS